MCGDRKIHSEIFNYIDGTLDAQTAKKVAEHLKDCPDCRRLEQEYRRAIGSLKEVLEENVRQHISNEVLVEYVDRPESFTGDFRENVELHLSVCRSCEQKAEMLRRVGAEQKHRQPNVTRNWLITISHDISRAFGRRPIAAFSAAAVLILAFAIVYWLVIERSHGPDIRFVATQDINWLAESTRSDQTLPKIREDNDWIRVGVRFPAFFEDEMYTIQLQTMAGKVLRQSAISQEDYEETGIGLAIKTVELPPGEYRLLLISRRLSDEAFSLNVAYPFVLLKSGT